MRLQWIAVPALVGALLTATNAALADQFQPSMDSGEVPECSEAPGVLVCKVEESETCSKYTIVEFKVGTETVVSRECSERTHYKKYFYWQEA